MAKIGMGEETKKWIEKAKDDLRKAKDNFKMRNYDLTSFLCQQSVEKSLKAVLIEKTKNFPRIHDLVRLGELVKLDKKLLEYCEKLSPVYIETRYPNVSEEDYTQEESGEDIKFAEKIIEWITKKIS